MAQRSAIEIKQITRKAVAVREPPLLLLEKSPRISPEALSMWRTLG